MTTNLMDTMKSSISPELIRKTATAVDEPIERTGPAMHYAAAGIVSGMMQDATQPGLSAKMFAALIDQKAMLGDVLGEDRLAALRDAVANRAGVSRMTSTTILTTVGPVVMSVLSREIATNHLGPEGLRGLLLSHKRTIDDAVVDVTSTPVRYVHTPKRHRGLLLGALAGLAALAVIGLALHHNVRAPEVPTLTNAQIPIPTYNVPEMPEPAPKDLVPQATKSSDPIEMKLMDTTLTLPAKLPIDDIHFDVGVATPTADSTAAIDALAADLKAHPTAHIRLSGHADSSGDPKYDNQTLSQGRADAVKGMLEARGVDGARISTSGNSDETPVADNANVQGRAENRRVEVTLTSR